jgi:integrase
MKRQNNRLTTLGVKALARAGKKPGLYPDGGNLFARVDKATGKVGYVIRYHSPVHKRVRDGGIGPAAECSPTPGAITLKAARDIRDNWRRLIDQGIDPIDHRKTVKAVTIIEGQKSKTFGKAAIAWMEVADVELKHERTRSNRRRAIERHLKPLWGVPAASLTPAMVTDILKPLAQTNANTAHRLRAYIHSILDHADKLGTPTDSSKFTASYFRRLIPRKEKVQPTRHFAALDVGQMPVFMERLKREPGAAARCLAFVVLSALRSNEAIGAKWGYIDGNVMTIPAAAMKTGKEFRVALSQQALDLLRSLPRLKGCDYIFAGRFGGRLSERVLSSLMERIGYRGVTVHGMRSTFRHFIGEHTDFDTSLAEYALSHFVGGKVERAYARGDNLTKRFAVMNAWADYIDPPSAPAEEPEPDNVIALPLKAVS